MGVFQEKNNFPYFFIFSEFNILSGVFFQHLPTEEGVVSSHLCFYPAEFALRYSLCFHELAITLFFFFNWTVSSYLVVCMVVSRWSFFMSDYPDRIPPFREEGMFYTAYIYI